MKNLIFKLILVLMAGTLVGSNSFADDSCELVQNHWQELKKNVSDWNENPDSFLPPVPSVFKLDCINDATRIQRDLAQSRAAGEFAEIYFSNEKQLAFKIAQSMDLAEGCNVEEIPADIQKTLDSAIEILKTRTLTHLNQIRNFPAPAKYDYYFSAIRASVSAERSVILLGGDFPDLLRVRQAMLQEMMIYLKNEVVQHHDFTITHESFKQLFIGASTFGIISPEEAFQLYVKILDYYRIDLDYLNHNQLNPPSDPDLHMNWINTATKTYDLALVSVSGLPEAKVRYRTQDLPIALVATAMTEDGTLTYTGDTSYMSDFNLETFACDPDPKAQLSVSRFGPDREGWRLCSDGVCMPMPWPASSHTIGLTVLREKNFIVTAPWPEAQYSPMSPALAFTFLPEFINRNEVLVEKVYSGTYESSEAEALFITNTKWKLKHNPKLN